MNGWTGTRHDHGQRFLAERRGCQPAVRQLPEGTRKRTRRRRRSLCRRSVWQALGLVKLGVNHETIFPGGRSSLPHAHSEDEEFVFVIEGRPSLWIDGELRELAAGLCLIAMLGVLA
ncbi:MAG: cupin domain-containing protein, partial [Deltaproteobacteria bacterium]|nr:cupin domain-containing protein [Deltaproteobacteria bacterium]